MQKFVLGFVVFLSTFCVHGSIILSDTFTYPDGAIAGAFGSPWTAHSGSGANQDALVIGEKLQITFARSEDVNAPLNQTYAANSGVTLYSSFTVNFSALPNAAGSYFSHFNSGSNFRALVWASTSGATNGSLRMGIGNTTGASAASGQMTNNLSLNQTYTVVTRYVTGSGVSTIWLNPTAETDVSVTASDATSPASISTFSFRQSAGEGTMLVDDLRLGTSFADVITSNVISGPMITAQPQSQTVTEGATATFLVSATGTAPLVYQWFFNGTLITNATSSTLSISNASSGNSGFYSVRISNNVSVVTSDDAALNVSAALIGALSVLTYNSHGNMIADWSTNSPQVQAIGRQMIYLNPDVITFQEIPLTNTYQMTNFVKAFLPGYALASNSGTDGFIRSVIASRFPITRSQKWLDGADLDPFGYTNANFTRDLFEAQIAVPGFSQPVHVFTTHLKSGASSSDDSARRAAEASAISNYFVTSFLTTNATHLYLLTGDMNEDISRPSTGSQQPIQRLANTATGLRLTAPSNPFTFSELTFSIQAASLSKRYDYILPCALLFSNIVSSQVFRTDLLNHVPAGLLSDDDKTASDHLPVLMTFANPYNTPFQISSVALTNQLLTLDWHSTAGRQYRVESSTTLTSWTAISSNITASGTNSTFSTNAIGSGKVLRVYRIP